MSEEFWGDAVANATENNDTLRQGMTNFQNFVSENFSSSPELSNPNAEAYVYYGTTEKNIPMWQIIDKVSAASNGSKYYISSTKAGKLCNNKFFNDALEDGLKDKIAPGNEGENKTLYEGKDFTGKIIKGKKRVKSFNDFFSAEYIKSIRSSNVNAIFAGDPYTNRETNKLNCFGRTEFNAIIKNKHIKTINGIDKNILRELRDKAPRGQKMLCVTEAIKAAQNKACSQIFFTIEKKIENGNVKWPVKDIVNSESPHAINLFDTLIASGKIGDTSNLSRIVNNNVLSDDAKNTLNKLISENKKFMNDHVGYRTVNREDIPLLNKIANSEYNQHSFLNKYFCVKDNGTIVFPKSMEGKIDNLLQRLNKIKMPNTIRNEDNLTNQVADNKARTNERNNRLKRSNSMHF